MWVAIATGMKIALLVIQKIFTFNDEKKKIINVRIKKVLEAGKNDDQQSLEDNINESASD